MRYYTMSGYSNMENPRFQIDMFTTSVDDLVELTDAVISALTSSTKNDFKAIPNEAPTDEWNDELGIYHRMMDVSLWNHDT